MTCPVCNLDVTGYCCARCGWVPFDPDATGDTGEADPIEYEDGSPFGPWRQEEED